MLPRDPREEHRASTPLELFFDLVFVVAVAQAGDRLHHALGEGAVATPVLNYLLVFFAIWWAWMSFSWFASAYDTEDIAYRLVVFLQLAGALILAAGVPRAFDQRDFGVAVLGYVVMRLAQVIHWLRAARADAQVRRCALRYAAGVTACQVGWTARLALPAGWGLATFGLLAGAELLLPVWAERAWPTSWHPGHIVERYGLFTIIVLGESILAASLAIQSVTDEGRLPADLVAIIVGGLLIVFSMWWIYFDYQVPELLTSLRAAFMWGYGHVFVFASVAAVGAGLAVAIDHAAGRGELGDFHAGSVVAVPVAVYLLTLWSLHGLLGAAVTGHRFALPVAVVLILAAPATGQGVLVVGLIVAGLMAIKLVSRVRATRTAVVGQGGPERSLRSSA
jgi:low temperature requirement protein LtrA